MGNCLNTASKHGRRRRRRGEAVMPEEREEECLQSIGQVLLQEEEDDVAQTETAAGLKVKVVLTRAELEWLMAQLKSGEQRLEDVLIQMGDARADKPPPPPPPRDYCAWRPRLECIHEGHEAAAGIDAT